ncbi:MAG: hypothetical protein CSYNP_03355 [Syntrophus sp. SKADARSKE-3]|nr:hypothetical protein [Syntrophus sp. SKADARSKE-3]
MFERLSLIHGGLKKKLMFGGCLMAILPIIILGTIAVYNAKTNIEKETDQQILMISKSIADMVDGVMTSESNSIAMLAQRDAVIQATAEANAGGNSQKVDFLQKELAKLQSIAQGRYDFFFVTGKNGIIFTDSVNGASKGLNASDRDYFKKTQLGQSSMDSVVISKKTKEPVCSIAYPIKDESGQVIGMIAGLIRVPFLAAKINEIKLGKTGYAYMINKEGMVIVYPDAKQVLQLNLSMEQGMEEVMKRATAGEIAVQKYRYKGVDKYAGLAPVKINGWSVVTAIPIDEMLQSAYTTRNIIFIGVIFFALLAAVAAYMFAKTIAVPIQRASEKLNNGSDQIAAASRQVAAASQGLAEGTSEQAAAIEETSSSLEEMSSMTRQNADNAGTANQLMEEANAVVSRANDSMKNLIWSMQEITKASEDTSKIIKTIDEIAFQTNLLALNASVEAARAGEAGAGFAVVADEVRNLAIRAADAAKNTSGLIESTIKKTKDGSDLVDKTNEDFSLVAQSAVKVSGLISEIAAASKEQAQGIGQISKAVQEMDKVVQQNAASAEESASASEEMNAQAEEMKWIVSDLSTMVGGKIVKVALPKEAYPGISGNMKTLPFAKTKNSHTGVVTPSQIIPMGDDKFKDF